MAEPAALAALAAQNQGKFWQMHDALFTMKPITNEAILAAATAIGLEMDTFNSDMASEATKQRLVKDVMDARNSDVSGTPTLFVNGRRVNDRSPEALQELINQELQKVKK